MAVKVIYREIEINSFPYELSDRSYSVNGDIRDWSDIPMLNSKNNTPAKLLIPPDSKKKYKTEKEEDEVFIEYAKNLIDSRKIRPL